MPLEARFMTNVCRPYRGGPAVVAVPLVMSFGNNNVGIHVRERDPHSISSAKPKKAPSALPETDATDSTKEEKLVCEVCRYFITTTASRIELFGGHVHNRINPAGFVFRLGLFADAPGVVSVTEPSREFAWFSRHAWQIVVCRGCLEHLGWEFSGKKRFFALLPEKLVIERAE